MIDTHSHLFDKSLLPQINSVISASINAGINAVICPAINVLSSRQSISLSDQFPNYAFPAVGIHPTELVFDPKLRNLDSLYIELDKIRYVLQHNDNVVAVGECGLDYYWINKEIKEESHKRIVQKLQHELLIKQLQLAAEFNLPIIIHLRDMNYSFQIYSDFFELIKKIKKLPKLHFHSFSGTKEFIQTTLKNYDSYFSFTSYIRNPSAKSIRDLLSFIPLDRLILETDSPYARSLNKKLSTPIDLVDNMNYLSEVLVIDKTELETITDRNAVKLYGLKR